MKIVKTPAHVLLTRAKPVESINSEVRVLIRNMKQTLVASDIGIGLAAPQVGIDLRIFLASPTLQSRKGKEKAPIHVFINPVIISQSAPERESTDKTLEGCLSIPAIWGPVARSRTIKVQYRDETGNGRARAFTGAMAVIIQHEIDHLNGILFTQRVIEQNGKLYRFNKKTEELERVEI